MQKGVKAGVVRGTGAVTRAAMSMVTDVAIRVASGSIALSLGVGVWLMGTVPAQAEPWFTYANMPTTDSLATPTEVADVHLARLEMDPSGWWTIEWENGQRVRLQFTSDQEAKVEDDRVEATAFTAQYDQEFLPSTGEVRYTLRHDRGYLSFQVLATDSPGIIDREVMLAEQQESGVQLVGNLP